MRLSTILSILLFFSLQIYAQAPAIEVRAAWLTTNWGLDWPTQGTSVDSQKKELQKILDQLQAEKFNVVLFQARAQGSVFYRSKIEPLSPFFNHSNNFDPLAFAIEECHKRGMECHAWIVTYTMEKAKVKYTGKGKRRRAQIVDKKPDYYKEMNGTWYLDPGRPETQSLIKMLVKEIVSNYDVDGIHFDYIRYPSNTKKFPDEDTFKKYGNGMSLYDWRRNNINTLVSDIYDEVKSIKKWVQVSSSPLGRYRVLPEIAPNDGWTAYETVFQDVGHWMNNGKHDLTFPMMYHREKYFFPYLDDWIKNSNGRIVVPGLGIYQMDEQSWPLEDIIKQMQYTRSKNITGQAYFRTQNVLSNLKGIKDSINSFYPTPAKLPPLTWLNDTAPNSPIDLRLYRSKGDTLNIEWEAPDDTSDYTYTIYVSFTEEIDTNDPKNILVTGLRTKSYSFPINSGEFGVYYFVTASNRFHNESIACFPGFFVHSEDEH
ncbi:glycoside hydrolase family 10 protein [Dysgonomonas sp. Marseille-P4361]|uniref:glycoside hydrolase family 10 protein n=1 Tax=Dysgonomonas sp. Marseille-P4361 TaxID=2161820 RepID=UPI000D557CA3|nr:family 10 glycosylhydrolase [Dysgonomonas sp. Marseille-P4361]